MAQSYNNNQSYNNDEDQLPTASMNPMQIDIDEADAHILAGVSIRQTLNGMRENSENIM